MISFLLSHGISPRNEITRRSNLLRIRYPGTIINTMRYEGVEVDLPDRAVTVAFQIDDEQIDVRGTRSIDAIANGRLPSHVRPSVLLHELLQGRDARSVDERSTAPPSTAGFHLQQALRSLSKEEAAARDVFAKSDHPVYAVMGVDDRPGEIRAVGIVLSGGGQ